jgi:hypothetical protein
MQQGVGVLRNMRVLFVSAAALLAVPSAAEAATQWPSQSEYVAGSTASVTPNSTRTTEVLFARVNSRGKILRVIERTSARRGTVRFEFGAPGRYSLRVGNKTRRYTAVDGCTRQDGDRIEIRLQTSVVPIGETVRYKLLNTSTNRGCVLSGVGYAFKRLQGDGTWVDVPLSNPFITIGLTLTPWKAQLKTAALPPAANSPGVYRIVDQVSSRAGDQVRSIEAFAQFEVH